MPEIKIPIANNRDAKWAMTYFDTVDSTNGVALALAREGSAEGRVVLADHQNSGRGRLDREWLDDPGTSVLMSVLLRPKFPTEYFFLITSAFSVAASQVISTNYSIPCQLKWPNDVMVAEKKIAGILAEASFEDGSPAVVVGMGLNCKQSRDSLAELERPATSILIESGIELDLEARSNLAVSIAARFAELYLSLGDAAGRISVSSLYRQACDTIGRLVSVEMADEILVGVAADVSVEGNLLVETDACIRAVAAGEVVHLRRVG